MGQQHHHHHAALMAEESSSSSSSSITTAPPPASVAAAPSSTPTTEKKKMFDELLDRAKYVLGPECGIGTEDGAECLADDFEFVAVVGPIPRKAYLDALSNFNLADSFDITSNYFGMHVDPLQPNRVWFMNRVKGIHTGNFLGAE